MKINIIKAGMRIDPYTFQPAFHAEFEWPLELVQKLDGPSKGTDEYYIIIGKSIMDAIDSYEAPILTWKIPFTEKELKDELELNGIKVWDNMTEPVTFPHFNGVIYDMLDPIIAHTIKIDNGSSLSDIVETIKSSGKNFSLYKLLIPHYHKKSKNYICVSDEEYDAMQDLSNNTIGNFYNQQIHDYDLFGKIRFSSW